MPVETAADRLTFVNAVEFGVTATVGAATFPGILDNEYVDTFDATGTVPVFICDSSYITLNNITRGTSITINSTVYTVRNIKPDGTGMSVLVLSD